MSPAVSPEAFGAAQARGLRQLQGQIENVQDATQQILLQDKIRTEKAQARDSLNNAKFEIRNFLYGDADNPGLYSRKGGDAINVMQEAQTKVQEIMTKYRSNMSGRAQGFYDSGAMPYAQGTLDRVQAFEFKSRESFDVATKEAEIQQAIAEAIEDPTTAPAADFIIRTNVSDRFPGNSEEIIKLRQFKVAEVLNHLHASIIEGMIARGKANPGQGHNQQAKKWLEAHRDQLETNTEAKLEIAVNIQDMNDRSLAEAQRLSSTMTEAEAMKFINEEYKEAQFHDLVKRRTKLLFDEKETMEAKQYEDYHRGQYEELIKAANVGRAAEMPIPIGLDRVDTAAWIKFQNKVVNGEPVETDFDHLDMLNAEYVYDRQAFLKRDLTKSRPHLDDVKLNSMMTLQRNAREGNEESLVDLRRKAAIARMLNTANMQEATTEEKNVFRTQAELDFERTEAATGKEIEDVLAPLMTKFIQSRSTFGMNFLAKDAETLGFLGGADLPGSVPEGAPPPPPRMIVDYMPFGPDIVRHGIRVPEDFKQMFGIGDRININGVDTPKDAWYFVKTDDKERITEVIIPQIVNGDWDLQSYKRYVQAPKTRK
jgi:hypothetical protein